MMDEVVSLKPELPDFDERPMAFYHFEQFVIPYDSQLHTDPEKYLFACRWDAENYFWCVLGSTARSGMRVFVFEDGVHHEIKNKPDTILDDTRLFVVY